MIDERKMSKQHPFAPIMPTVSIEDPLLAIIQISRTLDHDYPIQVSGLSLYSFLIFVIYLMKPVDLNWSSVKRTHLHVSLTV